MPQLRRHCQEYMYSHRSPLTVFALWSLACNSNGTYFFKSCHARSRVCYWLWSSYILVSWGPAALTPFGSVTDLANCNKEWFTDSKCKPEDSAALRHEFASANKMVPSLRTSRIKSLLRPELWHIVAIGPRQVWSTQASAGVAPREIANPISLLTLLGIMSRPRALQSALVALWTQIWHTWTGPCSVLPGSRHQERHVFQEYIVLLYT